MHISTPQGSIQLSVVPNTGDGELFSNVSVNGKRGLPTVIKGKVPAVICGGGPSLADTLEKVRELANEGATVYALNNAAAFLAKHGIKVDGQIILDARKGNVDFVKDSPAEMLYLASQCDPSLFEAATKPVMIWHPVIDGIEKYVDARCQIGGGTSVGLSGLCLVYTLGHRDFHLFGYDSSSREGSSHAYEQNLNKGQDEIRMAVNNRVFYSSVTMAMQARKFLPLVEELSNLGCRIHVHGDGLVQHIVRTKAEQDAERALQAVYDLGTSPPTYDFVTFLAEAEKARLAGGFSCIDLTFMPGPIYGFRDDNLPPDVAERQGMLHRVCVSMCRLLPSIRNVSAPKRRSVIEGDVFPEGWSEENPINHYGPRFFVGALPILKATESAKRMALRITGEKPYVIIPVRQAEYWPHRNTNVQAWKYATEWLEELGTNVFWIPDTNGDPVPGEKNIPAASVDIDLRLALYESARLVTGLIGGAACLSMFANVTYAFIHPLGEKPTTDAAYLKRLGVDMSGDWTPRGRVIFGKDDQFTAKKLLWEHFYGIPTETEALQLAVNT